MPFRHFVYRPKFHAIATVQTGPGKDHGKDVSYRNKTGFKVHLEDEGRYGVTRNKNDLFKFRTPGLRNVELTGPWGHTGAYHTLEVIIRHHANPVTSLKSYQVSQVGLPVAD